jgi:hypothetical protein
MTTFRILPVLLLAFSFYLNAASAQNRSLSSLPSNTDPDKTRINWTEPHSERISDTQILKYLHFREAMYDPDYSNLPLYFTLIDLPANATGFDVELTDMTFEPETDRSLIKDIEVIESSPKVTAATAYKKGIPFGRLTILPFRKSASGVIERLTSFNYNVSPSYDQVRVAASGSFAGNSVLSSGTWYKIGVPAHGVYKINYTFLKNLGIDTENLNPGFIRIYGNGGGMLPFANSAFRHDDLVENAIRVVDINNNGKFDAEDYILFYGEGPTKWTLNQTDQRFSHKINDYSDTTYYFLNTDLGPGKRIVTVSSSSQSKTHDVNTFDDYTVYNPDKFNLLKSGREWYGDHFEAVLNQSFSLGFSNIYTATPVYIKVDAIARTTSGSTMNVYANNQSVLNLSFPATTTYVYDIFAKGALMPNNATFNSGSDNITITLNYNPAGSISMAWLNYIELNARRYLKMSSNQLIFRDKNSVGQGNVAEFQLQSSVPAETEVWDITNPLEPRKHIIDFSGTNGTFRVETEILREFIAFNTYFLTPRAAGQVMNQNLHALSQAEMVIVAPPVFQSEANRLADFHRNNTNLSVHVVSPEQIYNEFSSGAQDITAIRDFMRMFYERAQTPADKPRFLLLFGDGSFDNKYRMGGNTNFIPTFQSKESLSPLYSFVSDDFYGNLDPNEGNWDNGNVNSEAVDIGIGRLPVKSKGEAKVVVDKIIRYSSPLNPSDFNFEFSANGYRKGSYGDWRNVICFVADDGDGVTHIDQADKTATKVEDKYDNYLIDKIYLDAYKQISTPGGERYPDVKDAINKRVERGALIINYTGHGGVLGWTHERVLEIADINGWKNINNLPAFFTATCEFARYDDPARTSAGELVLLNPSGGAIALLSTTRVVFASTNFTLNKAFYDHVFEPESNGEMPFIGEVFRRTKNSTAGGINDLNFSLLGDPAQKLAYPKFDVVTTKINDLPVSNDPDTIQGLSKVTVEGMVVDRNGQKISSFTGILYPTVFDKKINITTLGQSSGIYVFNLRKNILYKGKASVINGDFTFTFHVPKDISYNLDYGSFSYYAHNGIIDAHGNYSNIVVGGIDTTAKADNTGPDIKLYMNDEKFVFGGMTNEEPMLYALVFDSCGINTAGSSIGHDITAILDEKSDKAIILNDYYQSDLDSYQSGKIRYPFSKLAEGRHTLSLKVWDVQNNSSLAYTEFVVSASADLALNHVLNYPNPFTTHTTFLFEHNRPNTPLDVQIQVFTISGKLVKTINQPIYSEGFRSDSIEWDGLDDYGDRIGRGVYIYRLRVRSGDSYADQLEKLVILK